MCKPTIMRFMDLVLQVIQFLSSVILNVRRRIFEFLSATIESSAKMDFDFLKIQGQRTMLSHAIIAKHQAAVAAAHGRFEPNHV